MPEAESTSPLEAYVLLANGAKGAAAVGLVQQVLEASTVYVFGELLDHPNIKDLETNSSTVNGKGYFDLLNLFAYGTYNDYLTRQAELPALTGKLLFILTWHDLLKIVRIFTAPIKKTLI